MKSILKLRTLTLGLLVIVAIGACNKPAGNTGADSNIDYYTCTMHPSVHSKTPGKCPICSMDLVPVFKKVASTNAGAAKGDTSAKPDGGQTLVGPPSENAQGNKPGEFSVPIERQQQIGVTYASAKRKLGSCVRVHDLACKPATRALSRSQSR